VCNCRWKVWLLVGFGLAAVAVPVAVLARLKSLSTVKPRIHVFSDMDNQPRYKTQQAAAFFADGRAMRPPVAGAIARGDLDFHEGLATGRVGSTWLDRFPAEAAVTSASMARGRRQYEIFCAPCHGLDGRGEGLIALRAAALAEAGWVKPTSLHEDRIRQQSVGQIYATITEGQATMPGYAPQISVADRWAIVAYVRALQRSTAGRLEDVPAEHRSRLDAPASAPASGSGG